jgi:AraC-like DNA-binding protein
MDVLTDLLQRSRARGAAFSHSTVHGDWGVRFGAVPGLAVHAIVDGETHLWVDDPEDSQRLLPGGIVLVRGLTHRMAHAPGAPCVPIEGLMAVGGPPGESRRVRLGDPEDAPAAVFFCGAYMFEGDLCAPLIEGLPDTVHLRPAAGSALRATMDLLAREMLRDEPGQQTLLDRLLDVALVQVLREHFTAQSSGAPAWYRALADDQVGAALRALHADPTRAWTVADMAAEANLSRATFARRFTALLDLAPLSYLTDWRMALACERLRDTDDGLAAIAEAVGYTSEFSFAAAFKRRNGVAPGRWRQRARLSRSQALATFAAQS